jgi:hypothetical protein
MKKKVPGDGVTPGTTGEGAGGVGETQRTYPALANVAGYGVFLSTLSDTRAMFRDGRRIGLRRGRGGKYCRTTLTPR